MKALSCRLLALPVLAAGFLLFSVMASGAAPVIETLARLGGDPTGYHPRAALIDGGDGFFYGTTQAGGPPNCGTVYKVAPDGALTTLYAFTGKGDGANPVGALVRASDGNFYGTTSGGGSGELGTVFKITPAGALTTLYGFPQMVTTAGPTLPSGGHPYVTLIQAKDGNLYGTANFGGTHFAGTAFRVSLSGAFSVLINFVDYQLDSAGLVEGDDGNFYGVQPYAGASHYGTVYQLTPAGTLTTLYTFTNDSNGGNPDASLIKGSDGNFYGTTRGGGGASDSGTIFRITPTGTLTTLHAFDRNTEGRPGSQPLLQGADGNFYGVTGIYGPTGYGTAFKITPTGMLTVLAAFPGSVRGPSYSVANALVQGGDGNFYGTTYYLGNGNAGTVFRLTPAGVLTTLHLFSAGGSYCQAELVEFPDGNFYGTTFNGGATSDGTIFGVTPGGTIRTVHDFNAATEGSGPATRLTPDGNGNYLGATWREVSVGAGCIYSVTPPATSSASTARARGPVTRDEPLLADLKLRIIEEIASPSKQYEDTARQGRYKGILYFFQHLVDGVYGHGGVDTLPASSGSSSTNARAPADTETQPTPLYSFTGGDDGGTPQGALVIGDDGNGYGTTAYFGSGGYGTVFRLTPDGVLTTLHAFAGTGDGAQPMAGLVLADDGNFYGTTSCNSYDPTSGSMGNGTIFRVTPDGQFTTLHTFASDRTEGSAPAAALLQASDGKLYGVTSAGGGLGSSGVVFSITTGGVFTKVGDLSNPNLSDYDGVNSAYGRAPMAALIQGSDGSLYGTTTQGGTEKCGVVYRVTLNPATGPGDGVPVVTLSAPVPSVTVGSGLNGQFLLTLSSAATTDTVVSYVVKGTAVSGTDYVLLKGTKKIKAGKTSKPIKVVPQGDLGSVKKTVKLTLAPGTGYTVGTTDKVKVKILPAVP